MTAAAREPRRGEGHKVIEDAGEEMRATAADLKAIRYRLKGVEASIPPTAQETSREDLEGEPDVETEIRAVVANGVQNFLDPLIDALLMGAEVAELRRFISAKDGS